MWKLRPSRPPNICQSSVICFINHINTEESWDGFLEPSRKKRGKKKKEKRRLLFRALGSSLTSRHFWETSACHRAPGGVGCSAPPRSVPGRTRRPWVDSLAALALTGPIDLPFCLKNNHKKSRFPYLQSVSLATDERESKQIKSKVLSPPSGLCHGSLARHLNFARRCSRCV